MAFIKCTSGVVKTVKEYYQCSCYSDEHLIKVFLNLEDNQLILTVGLRKFNFFQRLVAGIKYIFGYECKCGHFDEFVFQPEDITRFKKVLEKAEELSSK